MERKVTIVYHGYGEPTLNWDRLVEVYDCIDRLARQYDIRLFNYISTNGSITKKQAEWLAAKMDIISISCDGPPEIQSKNRSNHGRHDFDLAGLCKLLHSIGANYSIRATITPETMVKQLEIVKYFIEELHAMQVRFEPVYLIQNGFTRNHAEQFVHHYIDAYDYVLQRGGILEYSDVRVNDLHSSYCDVARNTLRLTPDGLVRNCFCRDNTSDSFIIGRVSGEFGSVEITDEQHRYKQRVYDLPFGCSSCINIYHCSRGCPDFCFFDSTSVHNKDSFRCNVNQLMAISNIKRIAKIIVYES